MSRYKTLETWLSEIFHEPIVEGEKARKLTAIGCFWMKPGSGQEEVLTLPLAGKSWTVETLFNTFRGKSEHKVQDIGGRHHFEMRAYYDGQIQHGETHSFVIEDGEMKANGAQHRQREDATKDGLFAQMMRAMDNKDQVIMSFATMVQQTSLVREQALQKRINDQTVELNDAYGLVREMVFSKSVAEHQMTMQQLAFTRQSEREQLMIKMGPSLLNAATGQDVIPDAASDSLILDRLAEKFGGDDEKLKMAVMAGFVTQEEAQMIRMRAAKVAASKEAERAAAAKVPAGPTGDAKSNVTPITKRLGSGTDGDGEK